MTERVENQLPKGTVTLLFTDIEGSTELLKRLREQYGDLLSMQRTILREIFDRWEGSEVDTQGDSFFISFPRATQAVAAAVEAQRALDSHEWPGDEQVRVRMGLHTGEPWEADEGYVGMDVHRAARIAHVGHGGQVLLSETTAALVWDELPEDVTIIDLGRHLLKDMSRPEHIRQLTIEDLDADFQPLTSLEVLPAADHREPCLVGACPYQGLTAFREEDAEFFYGREEFVSHLMEAVKTQPMVAVIVGSSGSGKSSAVFAGLIPGLRKEGDWLIAKFRPGDQPFHALAKSLQPLLDTNVDATDQLVATRKLGDALREGDLPLADAFKQVLDQNPSAQRMLLVMDQFEELYTLCSHENIRHRFKDEVLAVVDAAREQRRFEVVLLFTMRADFMGQALTHRPFADALQEASLLMGPMNREELRMVVEKPADSQGAVFEAGLVERILDDVGQKPGNLPLLEFALTLLWEEQDDGWLTHEDYESIGCVEGALARYADTVIDELDEQDQEQARHILVQLVNPGEGTEDTRRVATRAELAEGDWDLVHHLANRRLVVTGRDASGQDTVEVVHEALIQRWGRFQAWMQEDRAFRTWQERLRTSSRVWLESDRNHEALLRGLPLTEAENWLDERKEKLASDEREFIQASLIERNKREQEKLEQKEYELSLLKRSRRFFQGLVGVFVLATIVAGGLSVYSFNQRKEALQAYSMSLAAHVENALSESNTATALALALAAVDVGETTPEVERVLRQAAYAPGPRKSYILSETFPDLTSNIYSLAASPVEDSYLLGFDDGTIIYWDQAAQSERTCLSGHTELVRDLAFSPDGSQALSASNDGLVILWDLESGQELRRFEGHSGWVRTVAFSPDGQMMVSGGFDGFSGGDVVNPGELLLWDLETGEQLMQFQGHPSGVQAVEFTPDGRFILASSGFFTDVVNTYSLILWDLESGDPIYEFDVDHDNYSLAIRPDGAYALSAGDDKAVHVWDLSVGQQVRELEGHQSFITSVSYTPDGTGAVSIDSNGRLIYWDLQTGEILMQGKVHETGGTGWSAGDPPMPHVGINFQGERALTAAMDQQLVLWDLRDAGEIRRFHGHESPVGTVAFSHDGQWAFSGSGRATVSGPPADDNTVRVWDVGSGEQIKQLSGHGDVILALDVNSDSTRAVSGGFTGILRYWDLETGREISHFDAQTGGIFSIALSPDESMVLTGSMTSNVFPDDGVNLWDLESGELIHHLMGDGNCTALEFLDSGDRAITVGPGNSLSSWDLETGEEIERYQVSCCTGFALHPTGNSIFLVDNADRIVREWDLVQDQLIRELGEYQGVRTRVAINQEADKLLISEYFGGLTLRDGVSGDEIRRFSSGGLNMDIAMSPDGRTALSPGPRNSAILWDLELPVAVDEVRDWILENRYVRELTCAERRAYQIEPLCE